MKHLLLLSALLLSTCTPAMAGETSLEESGNRYVLRKTEEGYALDVANGWTRGTPGSEDYVLDLDGFVVRFSYTFTPNSVKGKPDHDPSDMLDVLEVPDGWMAWPAYQSIPEAGTGTVRIVPNLLG